MRRPQLNFLLIGGLLLALFAGIGLSHFMNAADKGDWEHPGLVLEPPRDIKDFSLLDANNQPYSKTNMAGRWQLLFFGFTHCPDVCPSTLALMRQLRSELSPTQQAQIDFVFVSIDPTRDSAEVLKPYLAHFDASFVGLRGSEAAMSTFTRELGIAYVKVGNDDDYSMDHSSALVLLNANSQIKAYYSAPHSAAALRTSLNQLLEE